MIKVFSVFGTRPEAIKMAPLVLALSKEEGIESKVCVTAQHREMLDQVLSIFGITPDFDLDIMHAGQTLSDITKLAMEGLCKIFQAEKPDIVLVHGDTTTTFAGALAAFYSGVAVGHVEAGLRTFDKWSPFPEEINRRLTGVLADLHFSPTKNNQANLLREGVKEDRIFVTGNTVIDAMQTTVKDNYTFLDETLASIPWQEKRVILLTAHRRENLGEPMSRIMRAVRRITEDFPDVEIVYPMHKNPAVRQVVTEILGDMPRVHLIEPLDVQELHNAMARAYMIMTDSGGLQEEAPSLGKPVLVLRKETERPEAVSAGTVKIAGVEEETIYQMAKELLCDQNAYEKMAKAVNPYGDGQASRRIVEAIKAHFAK